MLLKANSIILVIIAINLVNALTPKGIELKVPVKQDVVIDYLKPEDDIIPPPQGRQEDDLPVFNQTGHHIETPPNSPSCIICIQSIPPCNCKSPRDCIFVSQTCHHCAHFVCRNDPEEICVDCWREEPKCRCGDGLKCKIEPRNCKQCAKAVCYLDHPPIATNQLLEEDDLEIEYDTQIEDSQ